MPGDTGNPVAHPFWARSKDLFAGVAASFMSIPDDLLAPIMIVVVLATALTGILLTVLGLVRAGVAIRFIPYPVIGGFLSATG